MTSVCHLLALRCVPICARQLFTRILQMLKFMRYLHYKEILNFMPFLWAGKSLEPPPITTSQIRPCVELTITEELHSFLFIILQTRTSCRYMVTSTYYQRTGFYGQQYWEKENRTICQQYKAQLSTQAQQGLHQMKAPAWHTSVVTVMIGRNVMNTDPTQMTSLGYIWPPKDQHQTPHYSSIYACLSHDYVLDPVETDI